MMTSTASPGADRWESVLAEIRAGAAARESDRTLLTAELARLRELGFAAARLPVEHGGGGLSLEELFDRVIRISAADSNLGHVWRGHIAFVEGLGLDGWDSEGARRWIPRIRRGDFVGNAQSERQELAQLSTRLEREEGGLLLSGTKYYTTGSIYADWIHLAALDGDERVAVTVSAHEEGVESVDDWDGFGQPLTGSGTTTFDRVPVDADEVVRATEDAARWRYLGSVFQLSLLAVIAGIARRAHEDTVDYVWPRRRTFGFSGETLPREDPLVQEVVGEVSGAASTARRVVLSLARDLDAALVAERAGDEEALRELQLEVYRAQRAVPEIVLAATTRLFEVGGASAVSRSHGLDRHWRNVRTIASHNPVAQRTRAIGQFELTGTLPEWQAPGAPARGEG